MRVVVVVMMMVVVVVVVVVTMVMWSGPVHRERRVLVGRRGGLCQCNKG